MQRSGGSFQWTAVAGMVLVSATIGLAACGDGGDDGGSSSQAGTPAATSNAVVATVGDEQITADQLKRHAALLRNGRRSQPKQATRTLEREALEKLLLQAAIEAEAKKRGVQVPTAAAQTQMEAMRKRYPSINAFHRFLGGLSEQDLVRQLHLSALSGKLIAKAHASGENPEQFIQSLPKRWKGQTTCVAAYRTTPGCGD